MKNIKLASATAERIYKDYLKRAEKCMEILPQADREEMLMEINSHIFEGLQRFSDGEEIDNLLTVLEKLGAPEEFLKPIIADKKIAQAVRTFNPKYVLQALLLNFKNGIVYSVFAFLYLLLFSFLFLIIMKLVFPSNTGLFYMNGNFHSFGFLRDVNGVKDVLGFWFIPVVTFFAIGFYFLITLFLRFVKKK